MSNITYTGVINDLHIPFHAPDHIELVLQTFEDRGVNRIIINGDLIDAISLNQHQPRDPELEVSLKDEFDQAREFLFNLRERFPKVEIIFLMGNHETRLKRYLLKNAPVLWNILKLEDELQLAALNITWFDYQVPFQLEKTNLWFMHSPPSYGKTGAMTSLERKVDRSYMYACTHRVQHACKTGDSGQLVHCWFNGWLGSTNLSEKHSRAYGWTKNHENWQKCASIVAVMDKKRFVVEQFTSLEEGIIATNGFIYHL